MNRLALDSADQHIRRGGRVVERTALEMRHTCKGIVGSNPTLSAIYPNMILFLLKFVV
jgi:hypothetical protein